MKTIAIANQKGGTGKTTTAHALGTGLARKGKKILFVDMDAQGNLSYTMGANIAGFTLANILQEAISNQTIHTAHAIQPTAQGDIIPSSPLLAGADTILADVTGREYKIKEALEPIANDYDFCILDTPPTPGTLPVNALTAADAVIAPAQPTAYSMTAISQLNETIRTVRKYCNPGLIFLGIVLTRYSSRAIISREVAAHMEQVAAQYGTRLFNVKIRECTAVKEAEMTRQSIFDYAPKSNAALDYMELVDEILNGGY